MEVFKSVVKCLLFIIQFFIIFFIIYINIFALFGFRKKIDKRKYRKKSKFAILVAAHNEEKVIRETIINLQKLLYPKKKYDIYVICDNCTDNTTYIVKDRGAIPLERFNNSLKGKGHAIEWALDKLFQIEKIYNGVVLLDADNLVSKNFLSEMDIELRRGNKVMQAYLDTKNPSDTWITKCYALSFWIGNRISQVARHNLNMYASLGGTGICIEYNYLKKTGWNSKSLTEDLEYTVTCILDDIYPVWVHGAVIYDEKPITLKASWKQRVRWAQGYWNVCNRYFVKLIIKAIKCLDLNSFDIAIHLIQPPKTILFSLNILMSILSIINKSYFSGWYYSFPFEVFLINFISTTIINSLVLIVDHKNLSYLYLAIFIMPLYSLTWFPITIQGFFKRKKTEWVHTIHTRSISLERIE